MLLLRVNDQTWPQLVRTQAQGVCLQELATGCRRWLRDQHYGWAGVGALSGDAEVVAVVSTITDANDRDKNLSTLDVVTVASGARRRLWVGPGFRTAESAASWSPDGSRIALNHAVWVEERGDEYWETVVVDADGAVHWQSLDAAIASGSNGAWLDDKHILVTLDNAEPQMAPQSSTPPTEPARPSALAAPYPLQYLAAESSGAGRFPAPSTRRFSVGRGPERRAGGPAAVRRRAARSTEQRAVRAQHGLVGASHCLPGGLHVGRVDRRILAGGPGQVPAVHHEVRARYQVNVLLDGQPTDRRGCLHGAQRRVVENVLDVRTRGPEAASGSSRARGCCAEPTCEWHEHHAVHVDHMANDVTSGPVGAWRLTAPLVRRDRRDLAFKRLRPPAVARHRAVHEPPVLGITT